MTHHPEVILDGIPIRLVPPDIDGDGQIGGPEMVQFHPGLQDQGISAIHQKSELAESLEKLDADEVDPTTKMSEIDFNANLNQLEKNSYGTLDFLVSVQTLPEEVQYLTRRFKRLSVSVGGLGRSQKVQMVTGERAHKEGLGSSLVDSIRSVFKGGPGDGS